jgi:nickel/cobalt transporter (NicO) family protein
MNMGPELLLIGAVAGVGVLHTIVPDHWVPITLIARQRGWSKAETARASFQAGVGHVISTLLIASVVWLAGVAVATRFGHFVDAAMSLALIGFGGWISISAWRELRGGGGHGHSHGHGHGHGHTHDFTGAGAPEIHGPELQKIPTDHGELQLSIYEAGVPPRFRLTGARASAINIETVRPGGKRQGFVCSDKGSYWESLSEIPEPHGFSVRINVEHDDHTDTFHTQFTEHDHADGNHSDHHANIAADPPAHEHRREMAARTALLLILGSSPMVEGIPAFFAASKYGIGLLLAMSIVFAVTTIATYVLLCVYSTASLQRIRLGAFERYGEVLSGAFIALVGVVFWISPVF